jgi:ABC-type antimicrobial peptide transport system permease subunit
MASLLGGLIRSLLYGVGDTDWVSLSIDPVLLLLAVGLLAALGPALHAASVDPAQALRSE